jgi:DNA mismatch repair protein MutH
VQRIYTLRILANERWTFIINKPVYDKGSVKSIYEHALKLTGKTLSQVIPETAELINNRNRGDLGTLVEKYYFAHKPKSNHGPDFPEAGLELKTTGVKLRKKKIGYQAKERLSLMMINYDSIRHESWESSSLLSKCRLMLIQFYDYVAEIPVTERKFVLKPLLCLLCDVKDLDIQNNHEDEEFISKYAQKISNIDLITIRRDWETIQEKIREGKAHELSEGDTNYLKASRKGSGGPGEVLRKQHDSESPLAKSRGFSIKQSFFTTLIEKHEASLNTLGIAPEISLEEATRRRFEPFFGMKVSEISAHFGFYKKSKNHKGFHSDLTLRILAEGGSSVPELNKADIKLKTIRVRKSPKTGELIPKEAMSFRNFKYLEIVNQDWEESEFFEDIERRFLFVIFTTSENAEEILSKAFYWNMPYEDRLEAQRVWEKTKIQVGIDARNVPKSSENSVAHVRPHARNSRDTELTPQGEQLVKKSFWLNQKYIKKIINTSLT